MKTVKDSDILKEAKNQLETKKTWRVCFAIGKASEKLTGSYDQAKPLTDWVDKMLDRYYCFEDWFVVHRPELAAELGVTNFIHIETLRPIRIQWLDWMIAYCENEESQKQQS